MLRPCNFTSGALSLKSYASKGEGEGEGEAALSEQGPFPGGSEVFVVFDVCSK